MNEFIDGVLADAPAADRQKFLDGLAWLDTQCQESTRLRSSGLTGDQQVAVAHGDLHATTPSAAARPGVDFFKAIKAMTITGYYTSEIGDAQEIGDDGNMFFTEFKGCTHPEHGA